MPRNRLGAKALNVVLGHPMDTQQVTLWVKIGKISCAIVLDLSARFWGVLSDGLDGEIAMEGLKLRGSRRCEPPADKTKPRCWSTWAFWYSGGESGTRTPDTRIMIPLL